MGNRFFLWLGAGVVAAGVTVGMLAGAGMANAKTDNDDSGGAKTSQSAKPAENKADSDNAGIEHKRQQSANPEKDTKDTAGPDATIDPEKDNAAGGTGRRSAGSGAGNPTAKLVTNVVTAITHKPARKPHAEKPESVEKVPAAAAGDPVDPDEISESGKPETPAADNPTPVLRQKAITERVVTSAMSAPVQSRLTLAAPVLAPTQTTPSGGAPIDVPPVLSAVGTLVFGLISFGESVIEGPPKALPGSGVTVERSTLTIGDKEVPADWYFPDGSLTGDAPERIIYLQHGFLARGVFYDYTASYLAKETNSIVVAPTLTSNIFATDGMWLGGEQMHRAVADLFRDENHALLDSAIAAGYPQGRALPDRVVLVGHSLGGGLVADTAGYMVANGTSDKLAGVVMFDGVGFNGEVARGLDAMDTLPPEEAIPLYNLSATPYFWNLFGSSDAILKEKRPDMFTGAQLLGGLHSDSMIGGNPLIQLGAYVLTGFGGPSNVAGTQVLAAGWINDMFSGDRDSGFYADPGETFTVPTPFGAALGSVRPTPDPISSLAREVTAGFFGLLSTINFATDVQDGAATPAAAQAAAAAAATASSLIDVIGLVGTAA